MNMYPLIKIIKEELHIDVSFEDVLKYAPWPGMKVMEDLGIKNKEQVYARWVKYVNEYPAGAIPYPNIEKILIEFKKAGIIQAVVSAKTKKQYQIDMVNKGLDQYMQTAILAEDTLNHKPHPEPLLTCLKRLNIHPDEAIYIGDAPSDALAAHNAKMDFGHAMWGNVTETIIDKATFSFNQPSDLLKLI